MVAENPGGFDVVIGRLEQIGERAKSLPVDFRRAHPELEPDRFWGMRDLLIHQYSKDDGGLVLASVRGKLEATRARVRQILGNLCS